MGISDRELREIILQVLSEIDLPKDVAEKYTPDITYGTVGIISSYLPNASTAKDALKRITNDSLEIYTLGGAFFECENTSIKTVITSADENMMMDRLATAKTVVLVNPTIKTLKNIANGEDSGIVESAVLKSILWGRSVKILIDFEPPKFKRGSFFEIIVTAIDAITAMGVNVSSYIIAENGTENICTLVTESDILDAYNTAKKTVYATADAVITPLAKDKANELNVFIKQV